MHKYHAETRLITSKCSEPLDKYMVPYATAAAMKINTFEAGKIANLVFIHFATLKMLRWYSFHFIKKKLNGGGI